MFNPNLLKMDSKVKVLKNEDGSVLTVSENNPEYAWVRVQQIRTVVDDSGFLRRKPVNAIVPGHIDDMKAMNFYADQELPGKVLVKESLLPFNTKDPQRDLKVAGSTGIVCTLEGYPIYRKTYYTTKSNADDIFVQHDNKEEIKSAFSNATSNTEVFKEMRGDFDI
jgi:hypothetical protein